MPEDSTKPLGPKLMNLPEGSLCDRSGQLMMSLPLVAGFSVHR